MDRLKHKVALVFGAGPNLGGTIAHFMAREGAKVAVTDKNPAQAEATCAFLASRGYVATAITGDASEETDISRSVDEAVGRFGGLDIMVNLAAIAGGKSIDEVTLEDWNRQIKGSLTAGMLTTKYALRAMAKLGRRGSLVHILSTGAHYGHPGRPGYTAVKAGLLNMARTAAMEVAHLGIRVNTITPIGMEHNLWTSRKKSGDDARTRNIATLDEVLERNRRDTPDPANPESRFKYSREDVLKAIPLGRFPRASDIAWAAVFLGSDESEFITGADIPVDGGVRARYPVWTPGDGADLTLETYMRQLKITEYGEPVRDFLEP
jgi:NAD(P)-dependent dehydrogenase (short-subunit alcohol dehydrogenase family)